MNWALPIHITAVVCKCSTNGEELLLVIGSECHKTGIEHSTPQVRDGKGELSTPVGVGCESISASEMGTECLAVILCMWVLILLSMSG